MKNAWIDARVLSFKESYKQRKPEVILFYLCNVQRKHIVLLLPVNKATFPLFKRATFC